ncbi:uncharacterized protein K452DRAFT_311497 [Aplosporella prunicola CBS 121167]|uniref:Aminotransferase class IV n=1 Tax=Aplosporella prunicola CBS 121167 TaxID=1176127 RepID=A0A6A6B2X0_9PEZI|nr:uncharacterized protein K452DRAFT_311497 [Aplosporella prunicola CBS 121167]KAF2138562.1 hypothetical protein K452DRAFT_311497 [Aplosporella prunicola CBS 121167]
MSASTSFSLFTSLRYDPLLLQSSQNGSDILSFSSPSPFYMLRYHRDRMLEAAQHFEWTPVTQKLMDGEALEKILLEEVESWRKIGSHGDVPLKVRVLFNPSGQMQTDLAPVPPASLKDFFPSTLDLPAPKPAKTFTPSPLTGGALTLGPSDSLASDSSSTSWIITLDTEPTPTSPHTLLKTTHRTHYDASRARSVPAAEKKDGQMHEVLLWNEVQEITEGSFTSAYFYRGGRWVTPPVGQPKNVPVPPEAGAATTEGTNEVKDGMEEPPRPTSENAYVDEGELREPFAGRWGHSVRSPKAVMGSGGQRGTTRRWALKAGLCMEEPISKYTVNTGEKVWVSNGVRGFGLGTVVEIRKQ